MVNRADRKQTGRNKTGRCRALSPEEIDSLLSSWKQEAKIKAIQVLLRSLDRIKDASRAGMLARDVLKGLGELVEKEQPSSTLAVLIANLPPALAADFRHCLEPAGRAPEQLDTNQTGCNALPPADGSTPATPADTP